MDIIMKEQAEYVFHFTGKLNQSYVIEDKTGKAVYLNFSF